MSNQASEPRTEHQDDPWMNVRTFDAKEEAEQINAMLWHLANYMRHEGHARVNIPRESIGLDGDGFVRFTVADVERLRGGTPRWVSRPRKHRALCASRLVDVDDDGRATSLGYPCDCANPPKWVEVPVSAGETPAPQEPTEQGYQRVPECLRVLR